MDVPNKPSLGVAVLVAVPNNKLGGAEAANLLGGSGVHPKTVRGALVVGVENKLEAVWLGCPGCPVPKRFVAGAVVVGVENRVGPVAVGAGVPNKLVVGAEVEVVPNKPVGWLVVTGVPNILGVVVWAPNVGAVGAGDPKFIVGFVAPKAGAVDEGVPKGRAGAVWALPNDGDLKLNDVLGAGVAPNVPVALVFPNWNPDIVD